LYYDFIFYDEIVFNLQNCDKFVYFIYVLFNKRNNMKKDKIIQNLRSIRVVLTLIFAFFIASTAWADSWPEYITDVRLIGGSKDDVDKTWSKYSAMGWSRINYDLNKGAGGDYIYLIYEVGSRSDIRDGYIVDMIVVETEKWLNFVWDGNRGYYPVQCDGSSNFMNSENCDLNSGSGGWKLKLFYTKTPHHDYDYDVVSSITVNSTKTASIGCYNTSKELIENEIDLNRGIKKSDDIYLHLNKTKKTNRPKKDPVMATDLVYNGAYQQLIAEGATGAYMEYRLGSSGLWTSDYNDIKAMKAGYYDVYYKAGETRYSLESSEHYKTIRITPSSNNALTVSIPSTIPFLSNINPSLNGKNLSRGNVRFEYAESENGTYSSLEPRQIGTYWVRAVIEGDANCYTYRTSAVKFQIVKLEQTRNFVAIDHLTYTGEWQKLVNATGDGALGVYYRVCGPGVVLGDYCTGWSQDMPFGKNAGDYIVYWYSDGNDIYYWKGSRSNPYRVDVTIAPKVISINWGEQTSFVYDGAEHVPSPIAEGLVKGDECSITVSGAAKNVGEYTATATALSNSNYKLPENVKKTFSVFPEELASYAAVKMVNDETGVHAIIDGSYGANADEPEAVSIPADIEVNSVEMTREFPTGSDNAFSTTVLPFDVNTANVSGLRAVLRYNGIKNGSTISMKVLWAEKGYIKNKDGSDKEYEHAQMAANTPYLVLMKNSEFKLKSEAYPITLKQTAPANTEIEGCNWVFHGTWKYKKWGSSCSTGKQDCDKETGFAYGFAASASEDNKIDVGTFVKVGEGAWIRPMRAYLVHKDKLQTPRFARANGAYVKRPTVLPEELPELMSIVIDGDGDENETTVIGQFNTRTGEFKMNYDRGKFDLKGRRVDGKNNARGAYYGKKVLKK